jgi:hypothetical protein
MDDFYVSHSRFSDPGPHADWLDATPRTVAALREAASQLVFHYWGAGDITEHGFPAARRAEITLRYATDMWARLRELDPTPHGRRCTGSSAAAATSPSCSSRWRATTEFRPAPGSGSRAT